VRDGVIAVEAGSIRLAGPMSALGTVGSRAARAVHDLQGASVTPGLADRHTHPAGAQALSVHRHRDAAKAVTGIAFLLMVSLLTGAAVSALDKWWPGEFARRDCWPRCSTWCTDSHRPRVCSR